MPKINFKTILELQQYKTNGEQNICLFLYNIFCYSNNKITCDFFFFFITFDFYMIFHVQKNLFLLRAITVFCTILIKSSKYYTILILKKVFSF